MTVDKDNILRKPPPRIFHAGFNRKITSVETRNGYVHITVNTKRRHADIVNFLAKLAEDEYATTWEIGDGSGYSTREVRSSLRYLEYARIVKRHYQKHEDGHVSRIPKYGLTESSRKLQKMIRAAIVKKDSAL